MLSRTCEFILQHSSILDSSRKECRRLHRVYGWYLSAQPAMDYVHDDVCFLSLHDFCVLTASQNGLIHDVLPLALEVCCRRGRYARQ